MLSPLIRRAGKNRNRNEDARSNERGVTIALVALAMVGIISMAALSIDVGTLYQAKAEAQRAADAGALTAARLISISGVTGDPGNAAGSWQLACGPAGTATLAAIAVAQAPSNLVGGVPAGNVTVNYGPGGGSNDCSTLAGPGSTFSVNPTVTVYVQNMSVPTFFAHIFGLFNSNWNKTSVSATATAEVYNPSGSGSLANGMVPVQPRCVKPWIIPNIDPGNSPNPFVNPTGTIFRTGIAPAGVIGETFNIVADCVPDAANCEGANMYDNPPIYNSPKLPPADQPDVEYLPALVQNASSAVPNGATADDYQEAIAGCNQTTVYACGTPAPNGGQVDLTENPVNPAGAGGDTPAGVAYLTNLSAGGGPGGPADTLVAATYPFQITVGAGNPLKAQGVTGLISTSNSIVTIPIYDNTVGLPAGTQPLVTILGFLQAFINQVNADGSLNVTVMNVSGCSNAAAGNPTVAGTSPVPIRLITPP
jgi:Flp pilus assembly protein TadG